ncbi:MAG TPA: GAF domain-containing protein [Ktedonobacterales bacterium]|nr:GAF domain-containing protein [Ktedonobacterales bacterium]
MLNVYRPVPRDLFAATPPVRSRRALRFFMTWYEAVAGAAVVIIMALLILPIAARAPLMLLWLLAYLAYISVMITVSRTPRIRQMLHAAGSAVARACIRTYAWLVYGPADRPPTLDAAAATETERDARGLALIQVTLALGLTAAALLFVVTLDRSYQADGLPLSADVASWLLFVLPVMRVARYASMIWIIVLGALVIICDGAAHLLIVGGADFVTLRAVALHAGWLMLVSLLPAISLRSLSAQRTGLTSAIDVVRDITALQAAPEDDFASQAAAIIAARMGYDEVNVLLATSEDESIGLGLRFEGAASDAGRTLVGDHYVIEQAQGITGWAAVHGEERLVNDVERDPDHLYLWHKSFPRTRAELALPLTLGGAVIGVLDVQSERSYAFGEDDVELLRAIALHLALSLDNAQRLTRARGLASVTQRIARRLLSQQELRAALEQVVMTARETLGADSVVLYPCDPEQERIGEPVVSGEFATTPASAAHIGADGEDSAVLRALLEGQPRFETYTAPRGSGQSDFAAREGVQAAAILPLRVGDVGASGMAALGVIFVNYRAPQLFTPEYREWCVALADLAALALQSAMLYQQVVEEERANTWIELHDGMGQDVSYGRMLLEQALKSWTTTGALTPLDGEKLRNAHQFIQALQRQVNYLIDIWRERDASDMWRDDDNRPDAGDARGLFSDLEEYAALAQRTLDMRCLVRRKGDDSACSVTLRHDARMIVREAVYNAYRHGRATEVVIEAAADERELRLCIRDNGCGFDARRLSTRAHGMTSMQRRTARHNGSFDIQSSREPGASGTVLDVLFRPATTGEPVEQQAPIEMRRRA